MAHPHYNQYQQNMHGIPPLQTQGNMPNQQRPYSPQQPYQQSPGAMSPTATLPPAAKRQRLSPQPQPMSPYSSQYNSPFSTSNPQYSTHTSPYAPSPPGNPYLSLPQSPAGSQPSTPSFHQPQPYQPPHMAGDTRQPPFPGAMLPPKVPASKAQKEDELEKSTAKDSNPNTLADVITGSGIDLQREEEALYFHSYNSQASGSTISPHGSFNQWSGQSNHGAFQGTGPLSQPKTKEEQEEELRQKHAHVARIHNEAASHPLTDPFLLAAGVRQRMSKKVYEHGIKLDLDGLFDKIPSAVQNAQRRETGPGSTGETIVELQATSLLNNGAPLVDLISLVSLAAEERIRTVIEDAFALAQGRRNTSQGIVPPNLANIAVANGEARPTEAAVPNISKTSWEAQENASSPSARLPTPPGDMSPGPQATIQFTSNPIVNHLKRRMQEDEKFEAARIAKRQKRLQGSSASQEASLTTPTAFPPPHMTKKERDRINKAGNTEEAVHKRANETAAMALGMKKGKKAKYSWMDIGNGGGSGAATPRGNPSTGGSASGTATPAVAQVDRGLLVNKRTYRGGNLEKTDEGAKIQLRDLVHVLELDGKERKALAQIITRMGRSNTTDAKNPNEQQRAPPVSTVR